MMENRSKSILNGSEKCFFIYLMFVVALGSVANAEVVSIIRDTKDCGGEYSGYQYTINSPNYPSRYPAKQSCIYTLRGNPLAKCDQLFNLQFLDFSLPPSENCTEDYVEIGDRNVYCGTVAGIRTYSSKHNSLIVRFHSNAGPGDKGFKILVTTVPCSTEQIDEKARGETMEQSVQTLAGRAIVSYFPSGKIRSQEDIERLSLSNARKSHPVYRPEIDFPREDGRKFVRSEGPSPPRVESLEENDENIKLKSLGNPSVKYPAKDRQAYGYQSSFRGSSSSKVEIVTPSSAGPIQADIPKISTYLFVPPLSEADATRKLAQSLPKNALVTPPPTQILLPNHYDPVFRQSGPSNFTRTSSIIRERQRSNEKFVVPARSYGAPDQSYYPYFQASDQDINTGEVQDNSRDNLDCQTDANLEPDLEVTVSPGNRGGFNDIPLSGTNYDSSISRYPSYAPNVDITPSTKYGPPRGYDGNNNIPANHRPDDWLPDNNFVPPNNFNDYPNLTPNLGGFRPTVPNFGNTRAYPECCNAFYTGQRFLLASPEFPSMAYYSNSYECIYTISPYSSNICGMRFNFKFFNHGTEDRFCSYGYVEIDGRRVCGCKKGLSLVSSVSSGFPKTIGVKYTGYPRTKFNGFLIEVIQEPCSNGYPYLLRSKKDIGISSTEDDASALGNNRATGNDTLIRTRRHLGYSYPKPIVGLAEDSWKFGNTINSHHFGNHENQGANLFSPLLVCQAFSFFDWVIAAKEAYLRNARCIRRGGVASPGLYPGYPSTNWIPSNGGFGPINPGYPSNGGPGITIPGYPSNGGPGIITPGYPGGPGNILPGPGIAGSSGNFGPGGLNFPSVRCEEINVVEGVISSPQYPINYPHNARKCFRFFKAPDYCQLELAVLDFDLENSVGCTKDYVIFGGQNLRYCGRSLAGARALFDISGRNSFEVFFASDSFGSGRGFSIGFSQKLCRGLINR